MKKIDILLLSCIFMVGCVEKTKPTSNSGSINPTSMDTINIDDLSYDIRDGAIKILFSNYSNEKIEYINLVDTFYADIKYKGKFKEIRADYEIKIEDISKNLNLIKKEKDGRFKFFIDKTQKMKTCSFSVYLKANKCVFKEIKQSKKKREYFYTNTIGVQRMILNLF